MIKTYSELLEHDTFEDRFHYLALYGHVGASTFGFDRWMNQKFYRSREWRQARNYVIDRDAGCDLALEGYDIHSQLLIHHMNPIGPDQIRNGVDDVFNPEYLITTTHRTHNAIHYGDARLLAKPYVERQPGDTALW